MTEGVKLSEEQFHALELWVVAAANRAAQTWPLLDRAAYDRRREEAKALLVDLGRAALTQPETPDHG